MIITKASGLNNTQYGKYIAPIKQSLNDLNELAMNTRLMPIIFPEAMSDNWAEGYVGNTSLGNFEIGGENTPYPESDTQDDYDKTIENNIELKQSFSISQQMVEDSKIGTIKMQPKKMMNAYYNTLEELGGTFLASAISTSMTFGGKSFDISGGDGKALFATDHPSITGGYADQSNLYNAEFSYENLSILETLGGNQRDANGRRLNLKYDTIIVPNSTRADALQLAKIFEVLNGSGKPDSTDRAGNYQCGRWNVIAWPFLEAPTGMTSGKSWFMLMDSNHVKDFKPFVWQKRVDLTIHSYVKDETQANIWAGRSRETVAVTNNWQGILAAIPGLGTSIAA